MTYINLEIVQLYKEGYTYEEIARKFNLTRERIRQLIHVGIEFEIQKRKNLKENETPIDALNLSKRILLRLVNNGISSLEKLVQYTEEDILSLPSIGRKGLNEISEELSKHNLCLTIKQIAPFFTPSTEPKDYLENTQSNEIYTPVEVLQLTERTLNALIKNGVFSIEQLSQCSTRRLHQFVGLGAKGIKEIEDKLKSKSFALRNIIRQKNTETPEPPPEDSPIITGEEFARLIIDGEKTQEGLPTTVVETSDNRHVINEGKFEEVTLMKSEESEFNQAFIELKKEHRKNLLLKQQLDIEELKEMASRYTSFSKFLIDSKIHRKADLKEYYPEAYKILEINVREFNKRWNKYYVKCVNCGTVNSPHRSHGLCEKCYPKSEEFKRMQQNSREKNKERWKERERKYLTEYNKRPEVIEKHRRKADLKNFGGNREEAVARDNYRCTNCNLTREDSIKSGMGDLCVSRIDRNKNNNNLDNLQTLCRNCFSKKHLHG